MKKKILLICLFALLLTGCGNQKNDSVRTDTSSESSEPSVPEMPEQGTTETVPAEPVIKNEVEDVLSYHKVEESDSVSPRILEGTWIIYEINSDYMHEYPDKDSKWYSELHFQAQNPEDVVPTIRYRIGPADEYEATLKLHEEPFDDKSAIDWFLTFEEDSYGNESFSYNVIMESENVLRLEEYYRMSPNAMPMVTHYTFWREGTDNSTLETEENLYTQKLMPTEDSRIAKLVDLTGSYTDSVGNDYTYSYCIPQFYTDSTNAVAINEKIVSNLQPMIDEQMEAMKEGISLWISQISFSVSEKGNVVSINVLVDYCDSDYEEQYTYSYDFVQDKEI